MARLLKRALEEEGHAVDIAADGTDGLWLAAENAYGAVVLDVTLPDFDGFEVCRRLRKQEVWVPVIMLTARDGVGDRVCGLDAGADDYLVKPFSLAELAARLRALARRDDRARPVLLAEGDLKLDPAARRAWREARNCGSPRKSSPSSSCSCGIPATSSPARGSSRRCGTSPTTAARTSSTST